jgi:hypothetical protein
MDELVEITPEDSAVPIYLLPLTSEELADREQKLVDAEARAVAVAEKEDARQSALKKLAKLGLTPEEITAITS